MPDNPLTQERGVKESAACPVTEYGFDTQISKRCTDLDSECSQENGQIWNPCFEQQQGVRYITVSCIVSKDSNKHLSCDCTKNEHKRICSTAQTHVDHLEEIDIKEEEQQPDQQQMCVKISEYNSTTQRYDDHGVTNYNNYNNAKSSCTMNDSIYQFNSHTQAGKKSRSGGKVGRRQRRTYVYNPKPLISKPKSVPIKDDKDFEYWSKRMRNNDAAKRSRENRRIKEIETLTKVKKLSKQNEELEARITELENKNKYLESLLCIRSGNENF